MTSANLHPENPAIAPSTPCLVIAGVSSGVGKTTVTVGLARALKSLGLKVALFKCGPDYLDPTYHRRAVGHKAHNLDGWMMGEEAVKQAYTQGSQGHDIAIIEGVMGLFDGASPTSEEGSTAQIAKWLNAKTLLVVDASGMARTIAALAQGFRNYDPDLDLLGLITNRVGSEGHKRILSEACAPFPIMGGLPKRPDLAFPERHLGLKTAEPDAIDDGLLDQWAEVVQHWFDLPAILKEFGLSPRNTNNVDYKPIHSWRGRPKNKKCTIALAHDEAFHFHYDYNLALLKEYGAELLTFSPIKDEKLPAADAIYLVGGYPEVFAQALAQNERMKDSIRAFAARGRPIYGECGGLMYLCKSILCTDGRSHKMLGLLPGQAVMANRLQALGYVDVTLNEDSILGPKGTAFRGHQFRYSKLENPASDDQCIYGVTRRRGQKFFVEGYSSGRILGSYVHAHWASNPEVARAFVESCCR